MSEATPVWVWLPGSDEPVHAGDLFPHAPGQTAAFTYQHDYLTSPARLALDPLQLRLRKGAIEVCHDLERKLSWRPGHQRGRRASQGHVRA